MFSFSKRRMRLGRVKKVQLSDSVQGYKSPLRVTKRADSSSVSYIRRLQYLTGFLITLTVI
jgi:hypothetical protein